MNVNRFHRRLEDLIATALDLLPARKTQEEERLGQALIARWQALADDPPADDGSAFWRDTCRDLLRLARTEDPRFFMRWTPIRATMVHGATNAIYRDWWTLRRDPDWGVTWSRALAHRQVGHPPPFPPMLSTNAMAIEHATHLRRFQAWCGERFHDQDCVVECGGGFGSMCRMIQALGFRGRYAIFDLPPVLALQQYYLGMHGLAASDDAGAGIRLCADLDAVGEVVQDAGIRRFAVMSTWALSEMPMALRARIEGLLTRPTCHHVLLAYQARFEGQDNVAYFADLMARHADRFEWRHEPVRAGQQADSPDASFYVFGRPRGAA